MVIHQVSLGPCGARPTPPPPPPPRLLPLRHPHPARSPDCTPQPVSALPDGVAEAVVVNYMSATVSAYTPWVGGCRGYAIRPMETCVGVSASACACVCVCVRDCD